MFDKWKWSRSVVSNSFATPWTVAYQAPQSMEFSRQEYWSGLPFPSPGDLPDSGTEPGSPALWSDTSPSEPPGKPLKRFINSALNWQTATAKSLQSCLTLCNPIDVSPPGSSAPGILQARTLEWVAISFSNAWKRKVKVKLLRSCLTLSDPMDHSLPGPSIHGIFQAIVLEWGAIAFSETDKTWCQRNKVKNGSLGDFTKILSAGRLLFVGVRHHPFPLTIF